MPKAVKKKTVKKVAKKAIPITRPVSKKPSKTIARAGETSVKGSGSGFPPTTQRAELWAYDEYNQGSIVASGNDIDVLVKKAKQYATESNVDNALAMGEKNNSWETYFPQFFKGDKLDTNTLYAGNKRNGTHQVYTYVDGKWTQSPLAGTAKARFYLGETNNGRIKSDWYLADHMKREITSLDAQALERKTVLFIKIV